MRARTPGRTPIATLGKPAALRLRAQRVSESRGAEAENRDAANLSERLALRGRPRTWRAGRTAIVRAWRISTCSAV